MWFPRFFFAIRFLRSSSIRSIDSHDKFNGRRKDDLRYDQVSKTSILVLMSPLALCSSSIRLHEQQQQQPKSRSCLHIAEGNVQEHAQHTSALRIQLFMSSKSTSVMAVAIAAAAVAGSSCCPSGVVLAFSHPPSCSRSALAPVGTSSSSGAATKSISRAHSALFSTTAATTGADDVPSPTKSGDAKDTTASEETEAVDRKSRKRQQRKELIRAEGGPLAFDTKYGALNPYAIYYGLTSIALGLVWFVALSMAQLFYFVTRGKLDTKRRLPVFLSHIWGTCLLRLTRNFPRMENRDVLLDFYKQNKAAMFVGNHNSWMDIPFIGATIGWRNYKFVAKKELEKVPILGKAIMCAKNVCVDRSDRRSQIQTLKAGMNWLKEGVHLTTFPEGTRSRSGKLMKFQGGAFKMAHKMKAPVVPLSIVASGKIMPSHWIFPFRPGRNVCKVVVHDPIESEDKTEEELAQAVREAIISGLPEDQRP